MKLLKNCFTCKWSRTSKNESYVWCSNGMGALPVEDAYKESCDIYKPSDWVKADATQDD